MRTTKQIYKDELIVEGISVEKLDTIEAATMAHLEEAYVKSKNHKFAVEDWENEDWENIKKASKYGEIEDTGVEIDELKRMGMKISTLPTDAKFHPSVGKIFKDRANAIDTGKGIDWGTAEALAFATLIDEGYHVRLSGQDVERGTFSHRHAHVYYQAETAAIFLSTQSFLMEVVLENFIASGSHLSEYAVLGFEYGYA